ncbi:hypothetical protein ES705_12282 [subsurface metagenome]
MRFTLCVLCSEKVVVGNNKDGICRNCWEKVENGEEITFRAYSKVYPFFEAFPKLKGRRFAR